MSITKIKFKILQPILETSCDILFFADNKDWPAIEHTFDNFDMSTCDMINVMWALTLTIPHRHKINNWYSTRYQFLDECMQLQFSPYYFQHIRAVS